MRKITVLAMISLDGVIQAPGGPKEDTSGGFKYGGWTAPFGDEISGNMVQKELSEQTDYILGRKTFFAAVAVHIIPKLVPKHVSAVAWSPDQPREVNTVLLFGF